MYGPEDPLFMHLLQFARVPFQAKGLVHKTPFWENLEILASTASIFAQISAHKPPNLEIFSSQAPNFGNFQFTSPQIKLGIFSSQAPFSEASISSQAPLRKSGPHTPTWKEVECPPPGGWSFAIGGMRNQSLIAGEHSLFVKSLSYWGILTTSVTISYYHRSSSALRAGASTTFHASMQALANTVIHFTIRLK